MGEDEAFRSLAELQPLLWRQGRTHPGSEAELNQLFGAGQVDLAMSYAPSFVEAPSGRGRSPTRPVPSSWTTARSTT